jgi:serine/threonine protein kinase
LKDTPQEIISCFQSAGDSIVDVREKITKRWIPQLMDAIRYVHSEKHMHRDIKPANILLKRIESKSGDGFWIPQLADFGSAKYLSTVSMKAKSYRSSPLWSAPELWSPIFGLSEKYSNKVDIWALGIVVLQLLFALDSGKSEISDNLLSPLNGKINDVPLLMDFLVSHWPNISLDVFELLSNMLVLEYDRFDIEKMLNHKTIVNWKMEWK